MKTHFLNQKRDYFFPYGQLFAVLLAALLFSCTNETLEETDIDITTDAVIESKATPAVGKTYTIKNLKSGRTLDIANKSNNNGANLQLWGTNANTTGTHRQWQILSVGDGYVRLKGVDSGKSLEVSAGSNSNGANVQQWAYAGTTHQEWQILSVGDGYFRLKNRDSGKSLWAQGTANGSNVAQYAYKGWQSQKWFFTEVGGSSNPPTTGDSPAAVLGITSNDWKLNGFTGSPSNDPNYVDNMPNLGSYEDSNYFYTDGEWVFFKCYRGLGGSENSDNPRVELREMNGSGSEEYWTNEGTNSMEFTVRVDQLSNNVNNNAGVVCVGQIHGPGSSVDDIIRVQFYGNAGQSSGNVRLKISGYITEDVIGSSQFIDNGYKLDTSYTMKITYNSDDYVRLYVNGSQVFSQKMDTDKDDNYFKVGNYIQESKGASYDGSNAIVRIKNLKITHTN
ncbi:RICIN domain-containing protein [Aquimarina pacifica]|uniref:RICIN domain-containing protein n=1 Tax=Aquimarina pacifica TaxID=1296415 RepID=UPI000471B651|nr:RICIN domain-containing protein [Aquimarina pacifica]